MADLKLGINLWSQCASWDEMLETAQRCGIRSPMAAVPSLALGTEEVTPLELAEAYGFEKSS